MNRRRLFGLAAAAAVTPAIPRAAPVVDLPKKVDLILPPPTRTDPVALAINMALIASSMALAAEQA